MRKFKSLLVAGFAATGMCALVASGVRAQGLPEGYMDFCLSGWVKLAVADPSANTIQTVEVCRDFGEYAVVTTYVLPPLEEPPPPPKKKKGPDT